MRHNHSRYLHLFKQKKILIPLILLVFVLSLFGVVLFNRQVDCRFILLDIEKDANIIPEAREETLAIANYQRPEVNSFLTFPEWYIVFSSQEYASHITSEKPSSFAYFSSIAQYWQGYQCVSEFSDKKFGFSGDNQLMLVVIGASFTLENSVKGIYENSFGRANELLAGHSSDEDKYAAKIATEYGNFLHHTPFYDFPFLSKVSGLWTETSFFGWDFLRKFERKAALTLEYTIKGLYGKGIKMATETIFDPAEIEVFAITSSLPADIVANEPRIKILNTFADGSQLVSLPRYKDFNEVVPVLLRNGVMFKELAGNDELFITAQVKEIPTNYDVLFSMPVLIKEDTKRIGIRVSVVELHTLINLLEAQGALIEHIFDY